jgi:hypothetical protein
MSESYPSRFGNSLADKMYKSRHAMSESSQENPDSTRLDLELEDKDEIYLRVDHVLDGLQSLLPPNVGGGSIGILTEIVRGMRRDISLVPVPQVREYMRSIGEACIWIADGSMADLVDIENKDMEDAGV